jgi:hypothetical protein
MKRSVSHPGRLLKRELGARKLSANRLSLDIGLISLWMDAKETEFKERAKHGNQ